MAHLFFSYSHKDETLRDELEIHLATLKRQGVIETWHDRKIPAGKEFDHQISQYLEAADIILLLVSPYFIASDYCYDVELKRALEKHDAGEATVIPVILHPSDWRPLPFGKLLATPTDGKPVSKFASMHDAFLEVSTAIREAAGEINARSGKAGTPSTLSQTTTPIAVSQSPEVTFLHQLPPPLADFTDRQDEVTQLQAKARNDCRIYGFFGGGGIGKTDLAKKFVHQHLLDRYPDAQFFVNLGGTTKDPKSVSSAQAHIISSVGTRGKMSETNDVDLSAKYNNALYGKRAILFLDDAANNQQIEPLTPPLNCAMIITSRHKLTLPGMHAMTVAPLKQQDAIELLLNITPRIGSHAAKIAELCGGVPFALRLAAGAIADRPDLKVEEFVERLADKKERVALVQATLDLSYDLLAPEMQNRFARLAVFPESFELNGAAAAWDLPVDETKVSLGHLIKISLLEWYEPAGRYSLQPLVRDFADAHLNESDRAASESMHATHYLRILREAGERYLQGDKVSKEGLHLFDAERSNITAAQSWFETNAKVQSTDLLSNFTYSASRLLALKQTPPDRIKWHQTILDVARTSTANDQQLSKRQLVEAGNLTFLAIAYRDRGDYDRTISYCQEALSIDGQLGDKRLESNALGYLGVAYYYKGNYEEAIDCVRKAVRISHQAKPADKESEAELLRYLGHACRGLGDYERAIQAYNRSLDTARQSEDLSAENNALGALGRIHCDAGQQELARNEYLSEALRLAIEIGDRRAESYALAHLGLANRDLGSYAAAVDHYEKALKLASELGHKQVETYGNGGIGKTYFALNDSTKALQHVQLAVKLASEINMKRAQQFWETMLAQVYLSMGDLDHAVTTIEKARLYRSPWVNYRSQALHGLILARRGQLQSAGESFKKSVAEAEQLLSKTPSYYDARFILGIAFSGMALANVNKRSQFVNESYNTFEKAYAACKAQGVVNEALQLLEELLILDSSGELKRLKNLLKGLTSS